MIFNKNNKGFLMLNAECSQVCEMRHEVIICVNECCDDCDEAQPRPEAEQGRNFAQNMQSAD